MSQYYKLWDRISIAVDILDAGWCLAFAKLAYSQSWGQWQCIVMHIHMNGYKYIMETYELDHIYTIFSTTKKNIKILLQEIFTCWPHESKKCLIIFHSNHSFKTSYMYQNTKFPQQFLLSGIYQVSKVINI